MNKLFLIIFLSLLSTNAFCFWVETKLGQTISKWSQGNMSGSTLELKFGPEIMHPWVFGPHINLSQNTFTDQRLPNATSAQHFSIGPHLTYNGTFFRSWIALTLRDFLSTDDETASTFQGYGWKIGHGQNIAKHFGINFEVQQKYLSNKENLDLNAIQYFLSLSVLY
ncbi:MAG: hypothetical protein JNM93_02735 [Bacteriovoracaceae bacterium]|nr:hypothetical protein [Bacteriovoracaceae bacterium]